MYATMLALKKMQLDPHQLTCAVQGFGNVGSWAAKFLGDKGLTVVAISDHTGGYYRAEGIDVREAVKFSRSHGSLEGFPGGARITNDELLTMQVDVLVPAAVENVITEANAGQIKARLIVEGANGPTSAGADTILESKGILIVPDILANAGGVTVSYFEWVQNRRGHYYSEDEIQQKTAPILSDAFERVYQTHVEYECTMRIAAYIQAMERLATGIDLEGNF
jgi:glutamate dehydrogenase (NAD(P)+)